MTDENDSQADVSTENTDAIAFSHQSSTWKVLGELDTAGAIGVLGHNLATAGTGYGVEGVTDSTDDTTAGVHGAATASGLDAETYGVHGASAADGTLDGPTPSGVRGTATGSGENAGVYGTTNSAEGRAAGVKAEATTGNANGILASSEGGAGIEATTEAANAQAIWARHVGSSGTSRSHAMLGETYTDADDVAGLKGISRASTTSSTYGVIGEAESNGTGTAGVRGHATEVTGQTYGVEGITESSDQDAAGVRGEAANTFNDAHGVRGITRSESVLSSAAGVKGEATATDGDADGVVGRTAAPGYYDSFVGAYFATGVSGIAADQSGSSLNIGVDAIAQGSGTALRANSQSGTGVQITGVSTNAGESPSDTENAAWISDLSSTNSAVLGLIAGYDTANSQTADEHNFVTFYESGGTPVGAIVNDGSGGTNRISSSADYAEFVPRLDPDEEIAAGDVVGVVGGEVTKRTSEAAQAMVVTSQPIVTGNDPGQSPGAREGYERIAFLGQVPVTVRGTVEAGDLIVPSGEHDGTARAIAPEDWTPAEGSVVGRAWGSTSAEDIDQVLVAVGLETGEAVQSGARTEEIERLRDQIDRKDDRIDGLASEVERLRAENERLQSANQSLQTQLNGLEDRLARLESGGTTPASADD